MARRVSVIAPALLQLGFKKISRLENPSGVEELIQTKGVWVRRGPRPWVPRGPPCFVKVTGVVEMTVAIDDTDQWWCVLKCINLEYLGFPLLGCLTTLQEE
jgi:hypothetical protein